MNKLFIFLFLILFSTKSLGSPNLKAKTAILVDYNSGKILYELEPDLEIYPASMTKIMTTIIAFDLLKANKLSLDDKFVVSEKAWRLSQSGYSSMFIMVNDEVSVEDLLNGIIIASPEIFSLSKLTVIVASSSPSPVVGLETATEAVATNSEEGVSSSVLRGG